MKVLVAEDDPVSRHHLERMLERWGHEVVGVASGEEAWERFQSERFPLVISDWVMPGMDGLELLARIREREEVPYTYVILLTVKREKTDLVAGLEAGADDFLSKPFDAGELGARLHAGERIARLQHQLADRNARLETAYEDLAAVNQRMTEDLEAAARIQQSLLPTVTPRFAGHTFAWRFEPCQELAGDILNVFPLDDRHAAFYLLDVSGHGVQAALLSVTLSRVLVPAPVQSSLLVRSGREIVPPVAVAQQLNERFARGATTGQFFTLVYGVLDVETERLDYVSAGHPGPVLMRPKLAI